MHIGVSLHHLGEHGGGVDVYTRRVLSEMLKLPSRHEFLFLYRDPARIGAFGTFPHLSELVIGAPTKLLWDQVALPRAASCAKVDLLFNPKYSLPLFTSTPGVFVLHGIDWYQMPWGSRWRDRLSHRHLVPRYIERAAAVVCVSESVRQEVLQLFPVAPERVSTVHYGVDEEFFGEDPPGTEAALRARFDLSRPFFLFVGQIYPPKNMARVLDAFARLGPELGIQLAVAGEHRWLCEREMERMRSPELAPWVRLCGWSDRPTLRALYRSARALVFPSLYEGFGLPIVEAMAAGCPVITSNGWSMRELAEGAALLVEPTDAGSIERAMRQVAESAALRDDLIARGAARVKAFSWQNCAIGTLNVLEAAYANAGRTDPMLASVAPR